MRQLVWCITAFTLCHSLARLAALLADAPQTSGFASVVELAIALSILLAASSLAGRSFHSISLGAAIVILGLVHGLGFESGLHELLDPNGRNDALIVASFNHEVEATQGRFAAAGFICGLALVQHSEAISSRTQRFATASCALVAQMWSAESGQRLQA